MSSQHVLLSPAELSYLHASLSLQPLPLRPDGRSPTQFRPLVAETGILPGTNGSARICFADGTEAIVGVKAEVERTVQPFTQDTQTTQDEGETPAEDERRKEEVGGSDWVEMTVEIPGYRDDDPTTVFLGQMLQEALLADGEFTKRLRINGRFHWKIYLDILLISPPLSYPLPLLSLTTHLALLSARLPRLKSEGDEDPLFDDDWAASTYVYPRDNNKKDGKDGNNKVVARPPVTLLVMAVGNNIIFDPAREELAVADVALAVSVGEETTTTTTQTGGDDDVDMEEGSTPGKRRLRLLSVRTIDPPSRLTPPGVPNATNTAYTAPTGTAEAKTQDGARTLETERVEGVWKAPRGGAKVMVMAALVAKVLEKGGVADEVLDGLEAVDLG
ncbi:ribosomal protein S5 domain 2-type protein [Diplogelasinospora grovesii]|uniref:Ribosomal RNA-processing protein 42 n=1 Tax=Diplogelasinospora grovesii TaxID=303347 RepID=A0AAN6NE09_9PEZI|nr:ribosomal protein S5 domain 2-type protein [Diplogelasinospora grovesii]